MSQRNHNHPAMLSLTKQYCDESTKLVPVNTRARACPKRLVTDMAFSVVCTSFSRANDVPWRYHATEAYYVHALHVTRCSCARIPCSGSGMTLCINCKRILLKEFLLYQLAGSWLGSLRGEWWGLCEWCWRHYFQ